MIENYLGNPKDGTGTGTWPGGPARDGSIRHFPQGRIPIVNMPTSGRSAEGRYGPCTSTVQAEVTLAWDAVVTAQMYSACWFGKGPIPSTVVPPSYHRRTTVVPPSYHPLSRVQLV